MTMITLALSKGRIFDETLPLLAAAGIEVLEDPEKSRKLILPTGDPNLRLLIVRASDVPTYVQYGAADLGIAFDGDADRVLMVDRHGELVDGDEIIVMIARERLAQGIALPGVVGTLMSNMGMELALRDMGLDFVRAKVGDRYVMAALEERGLVGRRGATLGEGDGVGPALAHLALGEGEVGSGGLQLQRCGAGHGRAGRRQDERGGGCGGEDELRSEGAREGAGALRSVTSGRTVARDIRA